MPPPCNLHEVQMLAGVVALNRFIARSTDRYLPFFKVLRKAREWDADCDWAFDELKEYLAHPLLLSQTKLVENLIVYLAVSAMERKDIDPSTTQVGYFAASKQDTCEQRC